MKKLKVSEIFYSLQGEGRRAGEASIFIRLARCNLTCGFCDTEFASGNEMSVEELHAAISAWGNGRTGCRWIVWTGGEPTLQLDEDTVHAFKELGYNQAIETNGSRPVPRGLDWVAVSPKVAEHVLAQNFPQGVDELRYVRHAGQPGIPEPAIKAEHLYLSPRSDGDRINPKNLNHCIELCLKHPAWKLSIQSHKLTKIL